MDSKVLTKEECKEKGLSFFSYDNGDYKYNDPEGYYHLIRNDDDLLKGKNAKGCFSFDNGDYKYKDSEGYYHLIRNDIDLLKGKDAKYCYSYDNGDYKYKDSDGRCHLIKSEPEKRPIKKGKSIFDLKLHETSSIRQGANGPFTVMKVDSGWIYTINGRDTYVPHLGTFKKNGKVMKQ